MTGGKQLVRLWARWCERTPDQHLGYGRNPIAELMKHGIRVGVVRYADEPETDLLMPRVDEAMARLKEQRPKVWASLMARHRQIIDGKLRLGAWRQGLVRPFTRTEIAEQLAEALHEPKERARQRLADRCEQGYAAIASAIDSEPSNEVQKAHS